MLFLNKNYINTIGIITISAGAGGTSTAGKLFDNRKATQFSSSGNNDDTTLTSITIDFATTQTISHIVLRNHNLKDFYIQHEEDLTLGTLWICDSTTDKIYHVQNTGTLISSFTVGVYDAGATFPNDISSANDGTLWICDATTDKIYNVQQAGTLISSFTVGAYDAGATIPTGISSANDGTLWICDEATDKIYNVQQAGTLISSFTVGAYDAGATIPAGISSANDGTLWICDYTTDTIYNVQQAGTLISSFTVGAYDAGATIPTGISSANDGTLWICDATIVKIYHVQNTGTLISSFAAGAYDAGATNPRGISIINGNFSTSLGVQSIDNAQTSNYFSFDTITTKRIRLTANKTITANEEKKVGEFIISKLLYDFKTDRLPPAKAYKPDLIRKQIVHKMSDGGIALYNIAEKFKAQLGFTFLPTTSANTLKTIYESKDPFYFIPWETVTSWDGDIFECNWMRGYGLMGFSDNDLGNGYKGKILIQETPGR
jgi:streptogramin lyase